MSQRFEPVRIGVVGMGNFGRLHALTLADITEADLVALVARRQASLDGVDDRLSDVPGWLNLEHAIAESGAEAWVVASSTASHVAVTRTLLEAGKTVLLEKPIANTLEEARSLEPLVEDNSSNLMLGHIVIFNSEYLQLAEEVKTRGPMCYINCVRHRPVSTMEDLPGENPFHLTMVHDLYAVQALVDRAEPCALSAQVHYAESGEMDLALAQLRWESGLIASFAASFLTPSGMASVGFDRTEVYGRNWMARTNGNPRPIEVWDDEKTHWPMTLEIRVDPGAPTGMMAEELRCFCRVARRQQAVPPGATYGDAMQVQRWMNTLEANANADRINTAT